MATLSGTIEARVEAGALALDEHFGGGWADSIELDRLNLRSSVDCVLGQLFGPLCDELWMGFSEGMNTLFGVRHDTYETAYDYGFDGEGEYSELNLAWEAEIESRL